MHTQHLTDFQTYILCKFDAILFQNTADNSEGEGLSEADTLTAVLGGIKQEIEYHPVKNSLSDIFCLSSWKLGKQYVLEMSIILC